MSRGTITSNLGGGRYVVAEEKNVTTARAYLDKLDARIRALNSKLEELRATADQAAVSRAQVLAIQDAKIAALNAAGGGDSAAVAALRAEIKEVTKQIILAARLEGLIREEIDRAFALRANFQLKQRKVIDAVFRSRVSTAWCADTTDDLSGEVGLIDIGRVSAKEQVGHLLIRPGFNGDAAFDAARDGELTPAVSVGPYTTMHAILLSPGATVWSERYRTGRITFLSGDTCSVTLDPLVDTASLLGTTKLDGLYPGGESQFTSVPIEYEDCNGAAFRTGDHVIIEFNATRYQPTPTVIGFVKEPRDCGTPPGDVILSGSILTATEDQLRAGGLTIEFTLPDDYQFSSNLPIDGPVGPRPPLFGSFTRWALAASALSAENTEWNRRYPAAIPDAVLSRLTSQSYRITLPPMPAFTIDGTDETTLGAFTTNASTFEGAAPPALGIVRSDGAAGAHIRVSTSSIIATVVDIRNVFPPRLVPPNVNSFPATQVIITAPEAGNPAFVESPPTSGRGNSSGTTAKLPTENTYSTNPGSSTRYVAFAHLTGNLYGRVNDGGTAGWTLMYLHDKPVPGSAAERIALGLDPFSGINFFDRNPGWVVGETVTLSPNLET